MGIASVTRQIFLSMVIVNPRKLSTLHFSTSSLANKVYIQLQNNPTSPENALKFIKPELDTACVDEVLRRLSIVDPILGLRFFVWAGIHTHYKHTSYSYAKACQVLNVSGNPGVVFQLLDSYKVNKCVVGIKMFNIVLNMCKECRLAGEALSVLHRMPEFGVHPNTVAYNIIIRLLCDIGEIDSARKQLKEMELRHLYPDMVTYVLLIKGLCSVGRLEDASELCYLMKTRGCVPNVVVYSALLDGISKFGSVEKAFELLEAMESQGGNCVPNVVTYTSMIRGFCDKGRLMDALKVLDRMELRGCSPNRVTLSTLLESFCSVDRLNEAHKLIKRTYTWNGVSCGECYSSLVVNLIKLKKIKEAEQVFKACIGTGVKLDGVACSMIIEVLCSENRVLEGFFMLEEIENNEWLCTIDSDIYPVLLIKLCEGNHTIEAEKVAGFLFKKKISLKPPYSDKVNDHLKRFANDGLLAR